MTDDEIEVAKRKAAAAWGYLEAKPNLGFAASGFVASDRGLLRPPATGRLEPLGAATGGAAGGGGGGVEGDEVEAELDRVMRRGQDLPRFLGTGRDPDKARTGLDPDRAGPRRED